MLPSPVCADFEAVFGLPDDVELVISLWNWIEQISGFPTASADLNLDQ
jgi:hypothetical protein